MRLTESMVANAVTKLTRVFRMKAGSPQERHVVYKQHDVQVVSFISAVKENHPSVLKPKLFQSPKEKESEKSSRENVKSFHSHES